MIAEQEQSSSWIQWFFYEKCKTQLERERELISKLWRKIIGWNSPNINLHLLFLGKEDPLPLGMWFLPACGNYEKRSKIYWWYITQVVSDCYHPTRVKNNVSIIYYIFLIEIWWEYGRHNSEDYNESFNSMNQVYHFYMFSELFFWTPLTLSINTQNTKHPESQNALPTLFCLFQKVPFL